MFTILGRATLVWMMLVGFSAPAAPQAAREEVRVGTRVLPPMVVQQGDVLTGFSIDLWNAIADKLDLKTSYQTAPDVRALLELVRSGKVEVGISAISITAAREAEFEFSQPMLSAGLQIMVRGQGKESDANPLRDLLRLLFSPTILVWLGIACLLVLVPAHLVWLLERGHPSGIIPTPHYIPGIFYALFWAASTLATQGEQMPRQWLARVIAVLWMFTGVVFVAFYTAQLAATLTVQQIQGGINGPDDLQGKKVATTRGSTAAAVLREVGAQIAEVQGIDDAYKALLDKQVDAVVFDSPVLLYYAANVGKGQVHLVGPTFRKEDYGIVFQSNSPLRRRANNALLQLRED
jgi:polar amino acid transport system substrate-binding protein